MSVSLTCPLQEKRNQTGTAGIENAFESILRFSTFLLAFYDVLLQGYFRKRGSLWSFSIELGRDPETGKRKQKTVSGFKTKKEAQIAASAILKELAEESYIVEKDILLATFISEWINLYKH